ncbi:MAG TPA: hypothetical protein VF615_10385 [Longimicrobiaceae bacterium]|jgi:hypothetical protein
MPKNQRPTLRLSRETLHLLVPTPKLLGSDPVRSGDTALCGPSRMETGCETTIG